MQFFNIILSSFVILLVVLRRSLRTIPNLLMSNSSFTIFCYSLTLIIQLVTELQQTEKSNQVACKLLAYFTNSSVNAICYSYLVTAISQYFFNILYRRKYLHTFRVHYCMIFLSWTVTSCTPLILYFSGEYKWLFGIKTIHDRYLGSLQYLPETHMCSTATIFKWTSAIYLGIAYIIPYTGIIFIYVSIVRHTRRTNVTTIATTVLSGSSRRDFRVLKNIFVLISILAIACLPNFILIIWIVYSPNTIFIPLYLIPTVAVSLCTNIQMLIIFITNKSVRNVVYNYVQHVFN
ncbi:unnamed protein product [Adineta steineri]|uniref:G-protein coupled receptors family 1 profile domain-containing protein n=1 Tax=Adineta steineri TaxID=433720 RepID=A0A819JXK3_9BILA|nr:unnamed protein product [Adineta steineri]